MQKTKNAPIANNKGTRANFILSEKLKNSKRFVLANKEKRPISPITNQNIDITNPANFYDYKTALKYLQKTENAEFLGIVLGNIDGSTLCGIDIDECINDNGKISDETLKIVKTINSYTEYSPSKKGLHILTYAKKAGARCKRNDLNFCKSLEIYDCNRYFTLTGNVFLKANIEKRQTEITAFEKRYFPALPMIKALNHTNISEISNLTQKIEYALGKDSKLQALWNGQRYSNDESCNDLGLMSKILYWNGYDIANAIELFKLSPYAAQKDQLHYKKMLRRDYLLRTAQKCLQGVAHGKL